MPLNKIEFNLKIFLIDKLHYELKEKTTAQIIDIIKENHKRHLHSNDENISIVKPSLQKYEEEHFSFFTYCYNQPKSQSYWQLFLPNELSSNQDFEITEFSFVLFLGYKSEIYCTVGGSGFSVIKRYIDTYFGIDLYQHFAKPSEDILLGVSTRGVAANISQKTHTYNYDQRISESLEYSEIPKKMKILVRDELKKGIFNRYNLDSEKAIMEIGSYFYLNKKLSFDDLKQLVIDIHSIKEDKSNYVQLTLFTKITDPDLIKSLDDHLLDKITDDIILHSTPNKLNQLNEDIIELVNPKKLERFYECDQYKIRFKRTHSKGDKIIDDRKILYRECTKHIFDRLDDISDRFQIRGKIFDLNIVGLINGNDSTYGNLYSHIVCEIPHLKKKYFRVDENWYFLDDSFIERITKDAINTYSQNKLERNILNQWPSGRDEDWYNKSHKGKNYYVLDKILINNIELCDILLIEENTISFIHVKNGFNTHMRNLYIQVILAAKRLWNDLYNNVGSSYLKETLNYYSKKTKKPIDSEEIYKQIIDGNLKVEFIMAYNNYSYKNSSSIEKVGLSESNIAKYSLVQTVKEMRDFRSFDIKVIDISGI